MRIGAEFLHRQLGATNYLVSDPTWGNHNLIFKNAGFTGAGKYRYWDPDTRLVDKVDTLTTIQ